VGRSPQEELLFPGPRIKARHGAKKAAIAVAASILTTVYHMLRDGNATPPKSLPPLPNLPTEFGISAIMLK